MKQLIRVLLWFTIGLTTVHAEQKGIPDYNTARRILWSKVYKNGGETLYCARTFGSRKGRGINVEHILPMSWATKALRCGTRKQCRRRSTTFNRLEADLHNLFPALTGINDARSSFRFGEVRGEPRRYGKCDFEVDFKRRVAEPRPAIRGEIARAMFYMQDEYGVKIYAKTVKKLVKWHRQDPPGRPEQLRNDTIEILQGTRNKYIDNPELVESIQFR